MLVIRDSKNHSGDDKVIPASFILSIFADFKRKSFAHFPNGVGETLMETLPFIIHGDLFTWYALFLCIELCGSGLDEIKRNPLVMYEEDSSCANEPM